VREEHKLQVFGNKMLEKICEPKKDIRSGQFRILYNEKVSG
jgi:hypothetical protein